MSTDGTTDPSPYVADPGSSYRPVATTAVLCLLGGILSLSSFFLPPATWVLPIGVVLFGIYVSWQLERARNEYAGQLMAKAGLLFALVAAIGTPTVHGVNYFVLTRESRPFADRFVDLMLENKVKTAFRLIQNPSLQLSVKDAEEIMKRRGREEYMTFASSTIVSALGGKGAQAQVNYLGARMAPEERGVNRLIHYYYVGLPSSRGDGSADIWSVQIFVAGAASPNGEWQGRAWWIESSQVTPYTPKPEEMAKFVAALK